MRGRTGRRRGAAALGVAALALAGCGTRLPDSAFRSAAPATPAVGAPTPGASGPATPPRAPNPASDVGVTPTGIRLGVIVGRTSPLGPNTFSASADGAQAWADDVDAGGGIAGRRVSLDVCDDRASGPGNVACVHRLIDRDHVFALVGVSAFSYDGAPYVNARGVPDVGGQPVGTAYDTYRHLWNLYGSDEPRLGTVGFGGRLYAGTEVYRWLRQNLGTRTAAVVSYNVSDSERFARVTEQALRREGYSVVDEQVNLALPDFDAVAVDLAARRVDSVFDAIDNAGNEKLCRAMDQHGVTVKAKVTTTQSWVASVGSDYRDAPRCRNSLYATGLSRSYEDTQYPAVARFRSALARYLPRRLPALSEWTLEGWASAQWFGDAAASCGARLTRRCVEAYLARPQPYDGHGLLIPRSFRTDPSPPATVHDCLNVAQWQDSADGGKGGWVTRTPDMDATCFDVPNIPYTP